jgi:hypothetical protein
MIQTVNNSLTIGETAPKYTMLNQVQHYWENPAIEKKIKIGNL